MVVAECRAEIPRPLLALDQAGLNADLDPAVQDAGAVGVNLLIVSGALVVVVAQFVFAFGIVVIRREPNPVVEQPCFQSDVPFVVQAGPAYVVIVGDAVLYGDVGGDSRNVAFVEEVGIERLTSRTSPAATQRQCRDRSGVPHERLRRDVPRRRRPRIEGRVVQTVVVAERIVSADARMDRIAVVEGVAGRCEEGRLLRLEPDDVRRLDVLGQLDSGCAQVFLEELVAFVDVVHAVAALERSAEHGCQMVLGAECPVVGEVCGDVVADRADVALCGASLLFGAAPYVASDPAHALLAAVVDAARDVECQALGQRGLEIERLLHEVLARFVVIGREPAFGGVVELRSVFDRVAHRRGFGHGLERAHRTQRRGALRHVVADVSEVAAHADQAVLVDRALEIGAEVQDALIGAPEDALIAAVPQREVVAGAVFGARHADVMTVGDRCPDGLSAPVDCAALCVETRIGLLHHRQIVRCRKHLHVVPHRRDTYIRMVADRFALLPHLRRDDDYAVGALRTVNCRRCGVL